MKDIIRDLIFWTVILIVFFGFNPWTRVGDKIVEWIQRLRSTSAPQLPEPEPKKRARISTSKVFVATAIVDGNVVQENIVANSDNAARNLAAKRLRVEPEEVDVEEIIDKVIRQ